LPRFSRACAFPNPRPSSKKRREPTALQTLRASQARQFCGGSARIGHTREVRREQNSAPVLSHDFRGREIWGARECRPHHLGHGFEATLLERGGFLGRLSKALVHHGERVLTAEPRMLPGAAVGGWRGLRPWIGPLGQGVLGTRISVTSVFLRTKSTQESMALLLISEIASV